MRSREHSRRLMLILLAGGDATAALREGSTAAGPAPAAPDDVPPERTEPSRRESDELDAEWRLWCGGQEGGGRPAGGRPALGAF